MIVSFIPLVSKIFGDSHALDGFSSPDIDDDSPVVYGVVKKSLLGMV